MSIKLNSILEPIFSKEVITYLMIFSEWISMIIRIWLKKYWLKC